jgi:ferric hydroxamate transport system substrate-binding protein
MIVTISFTFLTFDGYLPPVFSIFNSSKFIDPNLTTLTVTTNTTTESRTINHSMGQTTVDGTPSRILALEWTASQILGSLETPPIGVTEKEDMKKYIELSANTSDMVDLGLASEPNFETIISLQPDLIIGDYTTQSHLYDQLRSIAPTIMFDSSPPTSDKNYTHLQSVFKNMMQVADAVNKHEKGEEIVEGLHHKINSAKDTLENANLNGTKFFMGAVDPLFGNSPGSVLWLQDSRFFMTQLGSALGLENILIENSGSSERANSQVGIEGLAALDSPDVHFFYIHPLNQDPLKNEWKDDAILSNLEMVKNNNTHPIGSVYAYGYPIQIELAIEKIVNVLLTDK